MRDASSYRGARRNAWRGSTWGSPECYYGDPPVLKRRSYISKNASKYMPHDDGKGYIETPKRVKPKVAANIGQDWLSLLGLGFGRSIRSRGRR